jgi:cytochrome c biogenesis factor
MILIGIIGLVMFTRKESPTLVLGRPVKLATMPYRITYTGMTSNVFNKDNQLRFAVTGLDGKKHFVTLMDFAVRNVEGKKQILARPAIVMQWWGDLYFAFEDGPETFSPNQMQSFTLTRGKSQTVDGYKVMLTGFSIPAEIDAEVASGVIPDTYPVTAHLSITAPDGTISNVATVNTRYKDDPIPPAMPETIVPGHDTAGIAEAVAFQGIDPNTNAATFYLRQASVPLFMSYTIEVSTRPAIGLVWLGTLLIVSGGLISLAKRASSC